MQSLGSLASLRGLGLSTGGGLPAGFGAASLYHDYPRQRYFKAPAPSISRASTKTVSSNAGLLSTVASGALALSDRGLSIEESRTNLCIRSEELSGAPWNGSASMTGDAAISPDGTMDADMFTSTGAGNQGVYQTITVTENTTYTYSQFVKLGTMPASDFTLAFYNSTASTFISQAVPTSVTLVDNEWRRTIHTFTTPAGCTSIRVYAFRNTVTAGLTAFIWGTQLEAGAFATSYIPTTSATATRATDAITDASPTSFASLAQGGAFVEWLEELGSVGTERYLWAMRVDGSNTIRGRIPLSGRVVFEHIQNGVTVNANTTNPVVAGQTYRAAFSWTAGRIAVAVTNSLDPVLRSAVVGGAPTGAFSSIVGARDVTGIISRNGIITRRAFWLTAPSDAELQALVA